MRKKLKPTNTGLNVRDILLHGRTLDFQDRAQFFYDWHKNLREQGADGLHQRTILSPIDREVRVRDHKGLEQNMLMFGSNSYLGLGTHPLVKQRVVEAMEKYGTGVGGPPLLNGYTELHRQLERRLAEYEGTEDALLYGSGYSANVGLMSGMPTRGDIIIYDVHSHASFTDGVNLGSHKSLTFRHNDLDELESHLKATQQIEGNRFVGIEGVYSMDGDLAPLDEIIPLCRKYDAILVLDDAHGTGVTGPGGSGTASHFGLHGEVDITLGTFSKAFGMSGGFVACSSAVAEYLRLFSRSFVFSASLPPLTVGAVHGALDVLEQEPEVHQRLMENVSYLADRLRELDLGFKPREDTAVIPLPVPMDMHIRGAAHGFHKRGIFLNHIEYPAVPVARQRFRISVMARHTKGDLDILIQAVQEVWDEFEPMPGDGQTMPEPLPFSPGGE